MEFYTQNGKQRPIRLSESTRQFAYDSLHHKYGLDTQNTMAVSMDAIPNFEALSELEQYDIAVRKIACEAPVRICKNEKISGAASLGVAIEHFLPATYQGEKLFYSVSHLTADFETVLKKGINSIREKAVSAYETYKGTEQEPFAKSCLNALDAFDIWHGRYLEALKDKAEYRANYENLKRVPYEPAQNFYEAVQSLWFAFAFIRLNGNWPGIGRIDWLLGDYLKKDLEKGVLTLDEAREILAHFFIKGCEWITGDSIESGDAQHYQNIVLSGVDENGIEVTNEVTYLVFDILEELGISDFPTTVRLNKNSDEKLLRRVADVMRYGGGLLAIYNEDTIIEGLVKDGYPLREARKFANDGCWEVQIPGKSYFSYDPIDSLQILQKNTLNGYEGTPDYKTFEELYQQLLKDIDGYLDWLNGLISNWLDLENSAPPNWKWQKRTPCTVISLFEQGCIENGFSYLEGGPVYNVCSPHIGGLADTVNSLYAIKKLVYDEKRLTLAQFMEILKNDWEGNEVLRQYVRNRYVYFGNDSDEVDAIAVRLLADFSDLCIALRAKSPYHFAAGVSTFGRQLEWSYDRLASAHGRKKGEVLAANCSPTPNTDKKGATSIIRSYCKPDMTRLPIGAALDIRLLPSSVEGEDGLQALISLMRGFVKLGGFFLQIDVVDASLLRLAQEHPEDYQTLSVRVSGWNARFVTLSREWQNMVIEQNEH